MIYSFNIITDERTTKQFYMTADNHNQLYKRILNTYGITPLVVDPWASESDALREYRIKLTKIEDVHDADCIIVAVAHTDFREMGLNNIIKLFKNTDNKEKVLKMIETLKAEMQSEFEKESNEMTSDEVEE